MFIINVIFIESTPSLKISRERMQICTFILFYFKIVWPIFTAVLVYFFFQSTLIKKFFSYLQFKIVNYSLLQYLSFFSIVPQFLFTLIQSSIVFGIVLQFFPQHHSFSIVPQFVHGKSKFQRQKIVQKRIILVYYNIFYHFKSKFLIFCNLPCFLLRKSKFHSSR